LILVAGSGVLDLTLGATTADTDITGSIDDDVVDASTVTAGDVSFDGLAGDDELTIEVITTGTVTFDGGDDTDTLVLGAAADLSGATVTLTDVEAIDLAASATISADVLDGETYTITGAGVTTSTLTVQLDDGGDTADLSSLDASDSVTTGAAFEIIGGTGDDTIIGTDFADIIEGGLGDDSLTGGDGADVFTYTALADGGTAEVIVDFDSASDFIALSAAVFILGTAGTNAVPVGAQATGTVAATLVFSGASLAAFTEGNSATFSLALGTFAVLFIDTDGSDAGLYYVTGSVSAIATNAASAGFTANPNAQLIALDGAGDGILATNIVLI
jgi:Ca2+-binding RTX toxin-like protein